SIYRFRGADVSVWNRVRDALCGDEGPMQLTVNFRTRPGVVKFVNDVCSAALDAASADLETAAPELRIPYSPLIAARSSGLGEGIDWLDCTVEGGNSDQVSRHEACLVVSRIRQLLEAGSVADPESDATRQVHCRDIAVLARTRAGLDLVDRGLRRVGIRAFNGASLGLSDRQEIVDLLTVLRLFIDIEDDYYGFAFLRSPFVGLRDETIARFRLDADSGPGPLLKQAARFLHRVDVGETSWFEAPESGEIASVERESLRRALSVLQDGQALVDRIPSSELLEAALLQTDYRLHLLLRPGADEAIASIERFEALLDDHRHLPLASFLELWDRWGEQDLGVAQASLFSAADDVVTLQTIHTAKGLEWPIVFLVGAGSGPTGRLGGKYVSDPHLGPIFMPGSKKCGPRAQAIASRETAAAQAEQARLLYVALTRARDRLVLAAPMTDFAYMRFLGPHLANATRPQLVLDDPATPAAEQRVPTRATASDPVTRTGGQIEAFDENSTGQLDVFVHLPRSETNESGTDQLETALTPVVYRTPDPIQGSLVPARVSLDWFDHLQRGEMPPFARPVPEPPRSRLTSATELSMRTRDANAWHIRYVHGVEEAWRFAPAQEDGGNVPAHLRGSLIHGVLERIEALDELSGILNETISALDTPPGIEDHLLHGTAYREALEAEITRVVTSKKWHWYVDGQHYRELRFLHLSTEGDWIQGAFDLYRPRTGDGLDADTPCVVDFKTHQISGDDVKEIAVDYRIQVATYRDAVTALAGRTPRVLLHFTHPNVAIEA
ncbi:MAG: 3'-5' exonuclease, partial [Gemmatimonadota bacterium]